MTIQERMIPRTEREKDLLKYGRSQARERIIKLLEKPSKEWHSEGWEPCSEGDCYCDAIALIKGRK